MLHPGLRSLVAAGNGEVQLYEITVPESWNDRLLSELLPAGQALPAIVARGGRAMLPTVDFVLHGNDILHVSASDEGAVELRHRLKRTRAVILLYSVDPAHQNRGLNGAMLFRLATALKQAGYQSVGGTWIADVNGASLRQAEKIGARALHDLAIFGKRLDD